MVKLSILLLIITLAFASALNYPGPGLKKQAVYPNSAPQNIVSTAQQNGPIDPNTQYQQVQQLPDLSIRAAIPAVPQQSYSNPQDQQQPTQVQPNIYNTAQQQLPQQATYTNLPQQYQLLKQFQYYPQQQFYQPQQPIYPAGTIPQTLLYAPNQRYPLLSDGVDQQSGNSGWLSGYFPPQYQWPNFPSFPAQWPSQLPFYPGGAAGGSTPQGPFYPGSAGTGNAPPSGSTIGPDSIVTLASNSDAPSNAEGNSIVLVGGNRKAEKIETIQQDIPKINVPQQQYVVVPQQQQIYAQSANGQNEREIQQLGIGAKGAISSYLIYKDAGQKFPQQISIPQQQYIQQLIPQQTLTQQAISPQAIPQQVIPQQAIPPQIFQQQGTPQQFLQQQTLPQQINPQQISPQQIGPQQVTPQQQVVPNSLISQQLDAQQYVQQQQFGQQLQQPLVQQQQQLNLPQQLVQQQIDSQQQQQLIPSQFIHQFVPPQQQKPEDSSNSLTNAHETASLAYQRFLLQSKQRSEEPSIKSGLKVEEHFPGSESPAVTSNSVDVDIARSSGYNTNSNPASSFSQRVSHAEAAPNAVAYAGLGGVAGAAPVGTAVTGRRGTASSAPRATAIAGTSDETPEFNIVPARNAPSGPREPISVAKFTPNRGYHVAKSFQTQYQQPQQHQQFQQQEYQPQQRQQQQPTQQEIQQQQQQFQQEQIQQHLKQRELQLQQHSQQEQSQQHHSQQPQNA